MRTKIVSAAKKTANIVGKAPKAISYIGRKLFASKTPPRKNTPSLEATFGILNLLDSLHKKPTENPEGLLKKVQQSTATPSLEATIGILNLLDSLHKKPTENPKKLLTTVQQSTATPSLEATIGILNLLDSLHKKPTENP